MGSVLSLNLMIFILWLSCTFIPKHKDRLFLKPDTFLSHDAYPEIWLLLIGWAHMTEPSICMQTRYIVSSMFCSIVEENIFVSDDFTSTFSFSRWKVSNYFSGKLIILCGCSTYFCFYIYLYLCLYFG